MTGRGADDRGPDGPQAIVLDVGHGNAAVVIDGRQAIVVDAGPGDLVGETLTTHEIAEIAALVISHRHLDHTSEIPSLLTSDDFVVRRLFVNSDPSRDPESAFERQLRGAANSAYDRHGTITSSINHTCGAAMSTQHLRVDVLAPHVEDWAGGIGSRASSSGNSINTHRLSAVVRVRADGGRSVLLCGDHDHAGLRRLLNFEPALLRSDALIYPHHGGQTGAPDEEQLARDLTVAVDPEIVVFSNGRGKHDNPRPEVVRGVRTARDSPPIRVLCTQLSALCSSVPFVAEGRLDDSLLSRGASAGVSCSGSLRIALTGDGPLLPAGATHLRFVLDSIGEPGLCVADLSTSARESSVSGIS